MALVQVSPIAYQPHIVIVHPQTLGQCVILRMPECVKTADESRTQHVGNIVWPMVEPGATATAHGKVYFFRRELEELYDRYREDFSQL